MNEERIRKLDKILPVVERVHGENHPELHTVAALYAELKTQPTPALLAELRKASSDFTPPADACPTFIKAYADLAALAAEAL